ncbi:MAG TPA: hypothetical protein VN132_10065 [Bdellovibrio sp.]|nr:hypothetical protein [Bdellovibrio sp.]
METLLANNKGFAVVMITALLPVLVGAVLVAWAIVAFIQIDLKMKFICRREGLHGQEQVAPLLTTLLAMNPAAYILRAELIEARIQAAAFPATIPHLLRVETLVRNFEAKQQELIRQSNLLLLRSHLSIELQLSQERHYITRAIPLFTGDLTVHYTQAPRLAVRPDSPAHPPAYIPVDNFTEAQALVQRWQYRLRVIKILQPFLQGDFTFEKACAVTLKQEDSIWVPQVLQREKETKRDRSLSRSP